MRTGLDIKCAHLSPYLDLKSIKQKNCVKCHYVVGINTYRIVIGMPEDP